MSQQVNRDYTQPSLKSKAVDFAREAYAVKIHCWRSVSISVSVSVSFSVELKFKGQGEDKTLANFSSQALHCAVLASASGCTGNKGLLTFQALCK